MTASSGADLRLLPPAVAAWFACFVVVAVPDAAWPAAIVGWTLCGALVAVALRTPDPRGAVVTTAALALLAAALACTVVALQSPARAPRELVEAADSGRFVTVLVVAAEGVTAAGAEDGRYRAVVEVVEVGEVVASARSPVLVFDGVPEGGVGIGATVRLTGTLAATGRGDDVAFLLFATGQPALEHDPPAVLAWANSLRAGFAAAAGALPGDGGDLLPGLSIGDTTAVDERLDEAMKATSLSHLTAVSGDIVTVRGGYREEWQAIVGPCGPAPGPGSGQIRAR